MKSHEWASLDGNKATVGITNYAQVCSGEIAAIINVIDSRVSHTLMIELPKITRK